MKSKKIISLICAVVLCMSYTMAVYATAYTVSAPTVSVSSTTTQITRKITGSMTASSESWLLIKHYFDISSRGGSKKKTLVATHGSGSMRTTRVEGTSTRVENVDSHNTYFNAYNDGWYGRSSNDFLFYNSVSIPTN